LTSALLPSGWRERCAASDTNDPCNGSSQATCRSQRFTIGLAHREPDTGMLPVTRQWQAGAEDSRARESLAP